MLERRSAKHTAQQIREAQAMQRAFDTATAHTFMRLRNIPYEVAARVLTAPPEQRRQF